MKKLLSMVLIVMMILSSMCTVALADDDIKVIINGTSLTMDQPPVIVNDRTLVPLRAIFEGLGATVEWDDATKTATGVKDGKEIKITIDSPTAYVDGKATALDVPAQILSSRTMVPVRFISESLGEKVDWDSNTRTVIITSENAGFELNFDNIDTFTPNKDFASGAKYDVSGVSITNEFDHTLGSGKSLKMDGRTTADHRIKFMHVMDNIPNGESVIASVYIYAKEDAAGVTIGAYGPSGTKYASSPLATNKYDVTKNTWTKLELEFTKEEGVTQIGICQRSSKTGFVSTLYFDDLTVQKKTNSSLNNGPLVPVIAREGKRPTPIAIKEGKTYDDLIFYDREISTTPKKSSDEMFLALPKDAKVMADHADMVNSKLMGVSADYAKVETIAADNMPFKDALRATVTKVAEQPYHTQMVLESLDDSTFENGDNMLIVFYLRTIEADNEVNMGQVQLIVEQEGGANLKVLKEDVKTYAGAGWKKVYLPFIAQKGYTRLCIRLGYYIQTVEFGGYQILNYGKDIDASLLPSDTVMDVYDKAELFTKDVDWRKDAWNRIEKIRKGDIKVIVKDKNGNIVPDADVKLDMYDHEFKWGTAINATVLTAGEKGDKYREAISTLYNTGVAESSFKAVSYMTNPEQAKNEMDAAKKLGLKYYRGHTMVWDRPLSKTYDEKNDKWISNTSVSEKLMRSTLANDKASIDSEMQNTIKTMASNLQGQICDWDVVNEAIVNNEIRTRFGNGVLNDWYKWAQESDQNAKMYINEAAIVGMPDNQKLAKYKEIIDYMAQNGVGFDGIGVQGHFAAFVSPKAFYDELMELSAYGKEMKITEFDCTLDMHMQDEEAEASFTRDIIILAYSMEQMDGFLMWGFWDGSHWLDNAPMFDINWNLKKTGEQYIDLVYNKWWTQEDGKTGADGSYSTRGYYGDYLITASKDGITKTVDTKCYKGNNNTVVITLD